MNSHIRYFTPPQLAKIWGVSPETIIDHIKSGRLKAFTVSPPRCNRPRWRISPDAVREYEELLGPSTSPKPARSRNKHKDYIEYV